jgi:hypothetical protein
MTHPFGLLDQILAYVAICIIECEFLSSYHTAASRIRRFRVVVIELLRPTEILFREHGIGQQKLQRLFSEEMTQEAADR